MSATATLSDEEKLEILSDPEVWFEACASIEITGPDGGKVFEAPVSNVLQRRMFEVQRWCEANQVPVRGIALKPRKKGCSTAAQAIGYHQMRTRSTHGVLMGEDDGGGDTLFGMLKVYAATDLYQWGFDARPVDSAGEVTFGNGSVAVRSTAKRPAKARGATPQFVHCTEVAHWPTLGKIDGRLTMVALLNSVALVPGTTIWAESTPNGVNGWFPETYRGDPEKGLAGAVTLEERKAGRVGNGWIKVFAAWHEFPESAMPLQPGEELGPAPTPSQEQREARGREVFGWTDEQIKWRRWCIAANCGGDEGKFDEEYPESEEGAFRASGRRRFDSIGLNRLDVMARSAPQPSIGRIDRQMDDTVVLQPCGATEGAWFKWREMPIEGCRYLIPVDVSTGAEQQKGSANPDRHSVPVLRDGYSDSFGTWHNMAVVARIMSPCLVALDVLADRIDRVSRWLNGTMTIVEVNGPGLTVIEKLKDWKTPTFERRQGNAGSDREVRKPGWLTSSSTKPTIITNLDAAIRGDEIDIWDTEMVNELISFVTHPDGTEGAETGGHDDDVMALAIGVSNRGAATEYRLPTIRHYTPREMRERLMRQGRRAINAETT